ncbi:MAG TPA: GNAT family N-acetyltransferase [Candidatus Acidoferrum sp.]|nr:GNAT family N-acetyltransferase [Candidatus Acidoferrum sp.]
MNKGVSTSAYSERARPLTGVSRARSEDSVVRVQAIRNFADLAALREEWDALLDRAPTGNIFLTFDWLQTWWRHYGRNRCLDILAAYEGRELVGLAPLMTEDRRLGGLTVFRRVAFLGTGISDRLDMLLAPGLEEAILEAFLIYLMGQRWDVVDLQEVPEESVTAKLLPELLQPLARQVEVTQQSVCPVIKLMGDPEAYFNTLGGDLRHNLRRYGRRLKAEHAVTVEFVKGGSRLNEDMQAFLGMYRKSFQERPNTLEFVGDTFAAFRQDVAVPLAASGNLLLVLLRIDGTVAAGELCFPYRGTCYRYNCCYDPTWKEKSLGTLLLGDVIRHAITIGCHEYDFLRGDEPYKYQWGAKARRHVQVRITRDTAKLRLLQGGVRLARLRPGAVVTGWLEGLRRFAGKESHPGCPVPEEVSLANHHDLRKTLGTSNSAVRANAPISEDGSFVPSSKPLADYLGEQPQVGMSDEDELLPIIDQILREYPDIVVAFRAGKEKSVNFVMGRAMKAVDGKVNAKLLGDLVRRRLSE